MRATWRNSSTDVIAVCLRAAVDGPYFRDAEFGTLMALTRGEMAQVAADWPDVSRVRDAEAGVTNVLNHLLSYPHGHKLPMWEEDINDALTWWRSRSTRTGRRPS